MFSEVEREFRRLLFVVLFFGIEWRCLSSCNALPVFIRGRPRGGMLRSPLPRNDDSLNAWTLPPNMWLTQRLDHFDASDNRTWKQVVLTYGLCLHIRKSALNYTSGNRWHTQTCKRVIPLPQARSQTSEWGGGCVSDRRRREDWALRGGCGNFWIFKIKMMWFGALWSTDFILNMPAREGSWRLDVFITTVKLEVSFIH